MCAFHSGVCLFLTIYQIAEKSKLCSHESPTGWYATGRADQIADGAPEQPGKQGGGRGGGWQAGILWLHWSDSMDSEPFQDKMGQVLKITGGFMQQTWNRTKKKWRLMFGVCSNLLEWNFIWKKTQLEIVDHMSLYINTGWKRFVH